jgi:hypothetical protein
MSNSEPKPISQELPEGTSLVVVKTKEGGVREMLRSDKGHFVKKPKPLIPTIEFTRRIRKILYSPSKEKGKEGLSECDVATLNMLRIAQNPDSDPKAMMAAAKAYEILMRRGLGKEDPSEQELDKLTHQAVKVVVIQAPQLMHPEIIEEKPKELLKPSFAEVLDVHTNPKP